VTTPNALIVTGPNRLDARGELQTKRELTLRDILDFYRVSNFNLSERTHRFYAMCLSSFERWHGGAILLRDLSDDLVSLWLLAEKQRGQAARTVNGKRITILVMWREAFRRGLVPIEPRRIPRMKEPRRAATSWTIEEVGRILQHCDAASPAGWSRARKAWPAIYWQALVVVIYDTSLRLKPLLHIPRQCANTASRRLLVPGEFQKNGQDVLHVLHPQTCELIDRLPPHELLFPWPKHPRDIWDDFRRILKAADLPCTYRDLFHKLRRTSYTQTYKQLGLAVASHHAGHSEDLSAVYLDRTQLDFQAATDVIPRPEFAVARDDDEVKRERVLQKTGVVPSEGDFNFFATGFTVRGKIVTMRGGALRVLAELVRHERCTLDMLSVAMWDGSEAPAKFSIRQAGICEVLRKIRAHLRRELSLDPRFNPIRNARLGNGGEWTLRLPPVEGGAA
jgi:integrase